MSPVLPLLVVVGFTVSPDDRTPVKIEVHPAIIELSSQRDQQSLVVQATYEDGVTEDVTDRVTFTLPREGLVVRQGNILRPAANGRSMLKVEYKGKSIWVEVNVTEANEDRPVSFNLDVMPV